jgi:hypothetical protein
LDCAHSAESPQLMRGPLDSSREAISNVPLADSPTHEL